MPSLPPSICSCGRIVAARTRCACKALADRERKARFDQRRPSARARGYDATWQKARAEFLTHNPTCRFCGKPAIVVDHVKPHKGDQRLFWLKSNWQALCTPCHSSVKQSRERR
ncbi:MAG TPA: HNH endonuclease signature motif containing protein [Mesorhizobium sp.]|jgi:5-methylcytosine-specific restriction endonuclease McrA|nr:HNH endonuclease signature motif containing protein [Mesorhizobium sp.]